MASHHISIFSQISTQNLDRQESIFNEEDEDTSQSELNIFGEKESFSLTSRKRDQMELQGVSKERPLKPWQLHNTYEITRLIDQPWRGAEACHYLMLSQSQLYSGMFDRALRTALLLRDYDDLFDPKKIHSLIGKRNIWLLNNNHRCYCQYSENVVQEPPN